jgi:hypothetical protein
LQNKVSEVSATASVFHEEKVGFMKIICIHIKTPKALKKNLSNDASINNPVIYRQIHSLSNLTRFLKRWLKLDQSGQILETRKYQNKSGKMGNTYIKNRRWKVGNIIIAVGKQEIYIRTCVGK